MQQVHAVGLHVPGCKQARSSKSQGMDTLNSIAPQLVMGSQHGCNCMPRFSLVGQMALGSDGRRGAAPPPSSPVTHGSRSSEAGREHSQGQPLPFCCSA